MGSEQRFWVLVSAVACCLIYSAPSAAKTVVAANREWIKVAVQDQINVGNLERAITLLREHLAQDDQDAESWTRLALLQARSLKCDDAQASLARATRVAPSGAQNSLMVAADHLRANGCVRDARLVVESEAPSQKWTGAAKLRLGYDDNVMLLPDAGSRSVSPESAFVNPVVQIDYQRGLLQGNLDAKAASSYTQYLSSDVTSYNSFVQTLAAEWTPPAKQERVWDLKFGNRFETVFVKSDGLRFFSWVDSLYLQSSRALGEMSRVGYEIPLGYQKFSSDIVTSDRDKRDGVLLAPSVWYAHRFERVVWNSALSYSQAFATGENYRSRGGTFSTGVSGNFLPSLRGRTSLSFTKTDYYENAYGRKDDRFDASLGVVYTSEKLANVNFSLDVFATDNSSNLSGASYKRNTVMGQVDYAF